MTKVTTRFVTGLSGWLPMPVQLDKHLLGGRQSVFEWLIVYKKFYSAQLSPPNFANGLTARPAIEAIQQS